MDSPHCSSCKACCFAHAALVRSDLRFAREDGPRAWLGWALIVYSALIYPLIGVVGHGYPALPMFGITPCPVTLFSFGVLLLAQGPLPRRLLVIPLLWALVSGSAAFLLAVPQDWPLLVSGLLVVPWLWRHPARRAAPVPGSVECDQPEQCVEAQPGQRC